MKPVKKILALILAGVMALALLTGCGKATSLNRTIAEDMAKHLESELAEKGNRNNISVSYQVPELRRDIAPCLMKTGSPKVAVVMMSLTKTTKSTVIRPSKRP